MISDTALKRPVLAWVANLFLLTIGIWTLTRMPVRQYPDIDPPVVSVATTWTGASAAVVESEVTKRIEEAVSGIQGVKTINSTSTDGSSRIDIEFRLDREIEFAAADVRDQLGRVRKQLPEDIDDPVVEKASASSSPVLWIGLRSDQRTPLELTDFARRNMIDALSVVPGVARIYIAGERRFAMRIWLDPDSMAARGVTAAEVDARLRQENVELPAGLIESSAREMSVRADARMSEPAQFSALVIRAGSGGEVRLGDIARIEKGAADYRTGLWIDGQPAIGLGIIRQSTANTLETAQGVREALERLRPAIPQDVTADIPYDESVFINASITSVVRTLVEASLLVALVILVFLRSWGATLIPMLAVPVSLAAAVPVMALCGFSVNVLTLLAFVLAIGLVVDDAIVVLENAYRRHELGEPVALAAARGTRQVQFAVISTTIVLVCVFVPISFQAGTVGRLFREFGITLAAAMAASGFIALTLTPVLSRGLIRRHGHEGPIFGFLGRMLAAVDRSYAWILGIALRWRLVTVLVGIAVSAVAVYALRTVRTELAPTEDMGTAIIIVEAPQGATMAETHAQVERVASLVEPLKGKDGPVAVLLTIIPGFTSPGQVNTAFVIVRLKDWSERNVRQQDIVAQLFPRLIGLPGCRAIIINRPSFGIRDFGQNLQAVVGSEEHDRARAWSAQLMAALRKDGRLVNLRDDVDLTRPQLAVSVDRDRVADLGLTASDVGDALAIALGERKATTFEDRGRSYDVVIQADRASRTTPDVLDRINLRSRTTGALVPLSAVVVAREIGAPKDLKRVDRRAAVTVSGALVSGASLGEAVEATRAAAARELPPTAALSWAGQAKEFVDNSGGQWLMFAAALLVVFLALAAQFESWIHPLIILAAVPPAFAGALAALVLTGQSLNIYSKIGIIMLIGLMAKNGILMVEFANQLRDAGRTVDEAAREAAVIRLRPILMTTIAAIAGAVPLAIAHGAGSEGRVAIGTVIIGGLTVATLITLVLVPVLYVLLARFAKPAGFRAQELAKLEAEHPESDAEDDGQPT